MGGQIDHEINRQGGVPYVLRLKLGLSPVQWFFTIFLIAICFNAKPCTCSSSSDQDQRARYTWNTTFQQMNQGLLFHRDNESVTLQPGSLGYYMGNSSQLGFNLTDPGWFVIPKWFDPWKMSSGDDRIDLQEASFSIVFTLSVVSTTITPLLFDILPRLEPSPTDAGGFRPFSYKPVKIEALDSTTFHSGRTIRVTTEFQLPQEDDPNPARYSVRINYDHDAHNLSVYLVHDADAGTDVPTAAATMQLDAGDSLTPDALLFAISSSMGQLLQLHTWNFTIDVPVTEQSQGPNTATIVSSVVGSAAATAAIAAVVYFYLNSKYRRWKKDLDKLAKTMQSLPGVPMQVDFADIKKATNNFHETMRLGQGGFGTVYRCKLPAPKKGELIEVAVKKFTRADNRGYEDFLAEVSIINRLRHKNIVPLVGWSYNKGEPILIYEYMPNGSLDQHLFRRSGDEQRQAICMSQWGTRYNLVKDIATGLQYVHHEYEPMVLHRDIKASNIMIDFNFQGRLGDFGLACILANGKDSYTDYGAPGTLGFRAPEYVYNGKATRKTDIFAFGVLVLEIVTGKRAVGKDVQFGHVTDWVWKLHAEGNLLAAVDVVLTATSEFDADEAIQLLQLGMACSSPNPSDRPSMTDAVQIISKSVPPPDIPLSKPPLVWPPEGWGNPSSTSDYSTLSTSNFNTTSTFMVEMTAGTEHTS
ncbi:L-type lectin-domain containing receptor kinase IX.1 [Sorghum bicolor]|nr:L-type lectin-domain containing receptor kinase IX.1 [Sorghum bicolor]|eukprot:XP_002461030.2 L-type lectin-domain containing receptor kinase IX.1 [Sorghum bicolor]